MHLIVSDFHLLFVEIKRRNLRLTVLFDGELKEPVIRAHPRI
jgi:hypothetical protein